MTFSVKLNPHAEKFIKKHNKQIKERIRNKINELLVEPFPSNVERVEGYKGEKVFRVRVGDFRILYIVRYKENQIIIAKIDKRGRVYN